MAFPKRPCLHTSRISNSHLAWKPGRHNTKLGNERKETEWNDGVWRGAWVWRACAHGSSFDPLEDEEVRLKASGDSRRAMREIHGPLLEERSQSALKKNHSAVGKKSRRKGDCSIILKTTSSNSRTVPQ